DADHAAGARALTRALTTAMPKLRRPRSIVRALAILVGLTVGSAIDPLAAAEQTDGKQPPEQSNDKSATKSDKSDSTGASKPEADAEKKPDDPCDPDKQMVNFELRSRLCKSGVNLAVLETSELLGNPTGGLRRGARYEGVTDLSLKIDLRPSFHIGGEIFARAYQIHGRGLSNDNLGNLNLASSIEAARTTRLNELWYEQHFDNWRLRIGQLTIGTDFLNPESARLFVNATFGWPTQPSFD